MYWQAGLVALFVFEGMVSIAWSWRMLAKANATNKLAITGPYAMVRHPIFATILWDGTGCLAFYFKAWVLLLALVPLSLLWSYLASVEETYLEYKHGSEYWQHFAHKGQLFPSMKGLEQDNDTIND